MSRNEHGGRAASSRVGRTILGLSCAAGLVLLVGAGGCTSARQARRVAAAPVPGGLDKPARPFPGQSRAAREWRAEQAGAAAVRVKYGIEWPAPKPRSIEDGKDVTCASEPPAKTMTDQVDEITKKYGTGPKELVEQGGPEHLRPKPLEAGQPVPPGRDYPTLLCDGTVIWLEETDPFEDTSGGVMAYDAPEGGHQLGLYDAADPTHLK